MIRLPEWSTTLTASLPTNLRRPGNWRRGVLRRYVWSTETLGTGRKRRMTNIRPDRRRLRRHRLRGRRRWCRRPWRWRCVLRAMVYRGPYKVRVEEKEVPSIEHPNDAIVRVTLAAICGSDLHLY